MVIRRLLIELLDICVREGGGGREKRYFTTVLKTKLAFILILTSNWVASRLRMESVRIGEVSLPLTLAAKMSDGSSLCKISSSRVWGTSGSAREEKNSQMSPGVGFDELLDSLSGLRLMHAFYSFSVLHTSL